MSQYTIYHNPGCSKSRRALEILTEQNVEIVEKRYLETGLTTEEVEHINDLLGVWPVQMVRKGEDEWKDSGLTDESDDAAIIACIVENPIVLERPIVIKDDQKATIARPPENIYEML